MPNNLRLNFCNRFIHYRVQNLIKQVNRKSHVLHLYHLKKLLEIFLKHVLITKVYFNYFIFINHESFVTEINEHLVNTINQPLILISIFKSSECIVINNYFS